VLYGVFSVAAIYRIYFIEYVLQNSSVEGTPFYRTVLHQKVVEGFCRIGKWCDVGSALPLALGPGESGEELI